MPRYRPAADPQKMRLLLLALLVAAAALVLLPGWPRQEAFVGPAPGGLSLRPLQASPRLRLRADKDGGKVVDADIVDEDDEGSEDESEDEFESDEEEYTDEEEEGYPEEAYMDYAHNEDPPDSWFERRYIDRHKVNMVIMDMYKKPASFFPHELQPGDTVRIFYMEPVTPTGDGRNFNYQVNPLKDMKESYFEGIILEFGGPYASRSMRVRAMVGSGVETMGMEMTFPIHSPLLTKIEVLRRGYIGRNKNAYFIRGMVGRKNVIPLDRERTEMDRLYKSLREDDRADEIPESTYPSLEHERYPIPKWWQDTDSWDEKLYDPDMFDRRSTYEVEILGKIRRRPRIKPKKTASKGKD